MLFLFVELVKKNLHIQSILLLRSRLTLLQIETREREFIQKRFDMGDTFPQSILMSIASTSTS